MVSGVVFSYQLFSQANHELDNMGMQLDLISKVELELNQSSTNSKEIQLAILKLNKLQKENEELELTSTLSTEQLKTLLVYREKIFQYLSGF